MSDGTFSPDYEPATPTRRVNQSLRCPISLVVYFTNPALEHSYEKAQQGQISVRLHGSPFLLYPTASVPFKNQMRGAWVSQKVRRPTLDFGSGSISGLWGRAPRWAPRLMPRLLVPLPLLLPYPPPPQLTLALALYLLNK